MRNGTLNLWIPCSVALSLSHRDSTVSKVYYKVHMTSILHTARISNFDSVMFVNRIGEKESFERSKEIEKDVFHVVTSMGQRKESPRGIEQTKKTHFDLFNPNFIFNYHINMCNVFLQLILVSVLNAFYDAISQLLRKNVEKRGLMDNLDGVLSILDEIVDGG